jgi:carbon monoxide dehydrogenase subunit G
MTGEKAPGVYSGKVSLKLGPFGASFEGEAAVRFDQAAKSGRVEGKGVDRRGGSRSRMTVDFALTAPTPETTTVRMDADVTLSGAIAQFGRTGIINETTKILIGDFVARLEERLAPVERQAVVAEAPRLGVVRLLWIGVKAWLGRMFGRAV